MNSKRATIQECIELGLNLIAQDLIWNKHNEKDIQLYIKQFVFDEKESK